MYRIGRNEISNYRVLALSIYHTQLKSRLHRYNHPATPTPTALDMFHLSISLMRIYKNVFITAWNNLHSISENNL
jgi:hypothetical protein